MIHQTLKRYFGFTNFLPGQQAVVERVTAGESAGAIFPTGAGKSLCYQLPALHLDGVTLVVSPLLSLMKDQLEFLQSKKIPAGKLDSSMSPRDYQAALQAARDGRIKILMISVERFKNERFRASLKQMKVSLLVVDEAHCISEWGHNFRPDYLKLPVYRKEFGIDQVLLLTATATPRVVDDMCHKFGIARDHVTVTGFYRKNLQLTLRPTPDTDKPAALVSVLAGEPAGPAIVYVTLQKTAEEVAARLVADGLAAEAYHAGMKADQREDVQNRFMSGRLDIVVATIAFGMGIDKRDIRKVVHYDLPKSIENYSQEIGRAGRDGKLSVCCVLGNKASVPVLENFVYGDTPEIEGIRQVLETIRQCPDAMLPVRLYELSRDTDIRMLPLKTLLVYLEMDGILRPRYTYFESYPFKLLTSEGEIAGQFTGERRAFVETLFRGCQTARVWTTPDIDAIVGETGSKRDRVLAALEYFDEKGWIELRPKSAVEVFEILDAGFDPEKAANRLGGLFAARETMEIRRIHHMVRLFEESSCLAMSLSDYFGESIERPCGRCSACMAGQPVRLPEAVRAPLDSHDFSHLSRRLVDTVDPPLSVDLITRFLCGITTPKLIRHRASKMAGFGRLAAFPYRMVSSWVTDHLKAGRVAAN